MFFILLQLNRKGAILVLNASPMWLNSGLQELVNVFYATDAKGQSFFVSH